MPTPKRRRFLIRQKQKRRTGKQKRVTIFNKKVSDFRWKQILFGAKLQKALRIARTDPQQAKKQYSRFDFVGEWLGLLQEYSALIKTDNAIGEKPFRQRYEERQHSAHLIHEIRVPLIQTAQEAIKELEKTGIIPESLEERREGLARKHIL
ncbi:MAG: hypothetical protein PHD95_00700 [Candidatus ainarchaeum sp.]|nr:hypothetical protein [Candidatus ainarchaeum sp.]